MLLQEPSIFYVTQLLPCVIKLIILIDVSRPAQHYTCSYPAVSGKVVCYHARTHLRYSCRQLSQNRCLQLIIRTGSLIGSWHKGQNICLPRFSANV